jgi:hypothetical protein
MSNISFIIHGREHSYNVSRAAQLLSQFQYPYVKVEGDEFKVDIIHHGAIVYQIISNYQLLSILEEDLSV